MISNIQITSTAFLFVIFVSLVSIFSSCHDSSSEKNEVTIQIEKPQTNQIIENPLQTEILIHYSAPDIIHRITISIFPSTSPENIVYNHDQLFHKTQVSFMDNVALSGFSSGTQFTMKVTACGDHDCNQKYETTRQFGI